MTLMSESQPGEDALPWCGSSKRGSSLGFFSHPVLGEWFLFGSHVFIYVKKPLHDDKENCVEPVGVASFEDSHSG